jgi:hypothetical protein
MNYTLVFARPAGWCCAMLGAVLAACAAAPVATAPTQPAGMGPAPVASAASGARAPGLPPAAPPGRPVPPASASASPATTPPDTAVPYSAAVAARFPDPAVTYPVPALRSGRMSFTTQAELQGILRELVRVGQGGTTVRLLALGTSQIGTPLEALLYTRVADASPAGLQAAGRPTVLLVGQQHGDEPASGEALIAVARELAGGRFEPLLDRLNVIVLPRANPDGAREARRASASGIDINRDHLLLRTPEAQALARLTREWRPVLVIDAHEYTVSPHYVEKFGAVQRFDALVQYATTPNLPEFITRAAEEWFRQPLVSRLKAEGLTSEWYHTTSSDPADKKVSMGGVQPDTGRNVNGLKNAVSLLIETRGAGLGRMHLRRRVHTHVTAIGSLLSSAAERSADIIKLRQFVDQEVSAKACQGESVVEAAPTPSEYELMMLDPVTGEDRVVNVAWESSLQLQPVTLRSRPCGYWLSAAQPDAVRRLRTLGVAVHQLAQDGDLRGETYREVSREIAMRPDTRGTIADPSGGVVRLKVDTVPALLDVKAGGYYVPLDQPMAHLAFAALEPDTPSSYLANGIIDKLDGLARVMTPPAMKTTPVP